MDGIGTYVTNDLNQQTIFDGFAVNYDNNGNVTASGAGNLSSGMYDAQNRLTGVTFGTTQTTTFKYDGLNRKISQTVGGATTYNVWDGWNLIEERGTGNTLLNSYVYGAGEIIERISGAGTHFYYQDGLGSTSHLADAAGALQESYKYNTFGQVTVYAPAGTVRKGGSQYDVRHLFTGQLWMPQSGLYDYRNRIFSPSLTRFLQPDPIGFAGDSSNLYRYCGNNAMNATDPLGFDGHRPTSSPQVWKKPLEPKTPYQVYNGQGEILDPGGPGRDSNAGVGDRVTVGWPGGTGAWGDAWDGGFDRTAGSGDFGPGDRNGAGPSGDGGQGGGGPYSGHITVNWWPQSLTFPYPGPPVSPEQAAWTDKGRVPTLIVATIIFAPELLAPEALPALMPSKRALETLRVVLQVLLKKQGPPKTPTLPEPFPPGIEEPWLPPPPP